MGCATTLCNHRAIGRLSSETVLQQHGHYVLKMTVNGASTTLGLVSWKMLVLCGDNRPLSDYRLPFLGKTVAVTSLLCPKNELQRWVNNFGPCIIENPRAVLRHYAIIRSSAAFLRKTVVRILLLCPNTERQQSINNFGPCITEKPSAVWRH